VPITTQHTQESLCLSHIYALAGMAGVNYAIKKIYDYGVDGQFNTVKERPARKVDSGVPLDFQAKATIKWELKDGHIVYDLEAKTYNDIVEREPYESTMVLILLCLPKDQVDWHLVETHATTMRHCCYYHLLSGEPTENENTKRIFIPEGNVLTPDMLNKLLAFEKARRQSQIV
jgi:hypothetical protein